MGILFDLLAGASVVVMVALMFVTALDRDPQFTLGPRLLMIGICFAVSMLGMSVVLS